MTSVSAGKSRGGGGLPEGVAAILRRSAEAASPVSRSARLVTSNPQGGRRRILLVCDRPINQRHGTGVQLLSLFAGEPADVFVVNFLGDEAHGPGERFASLPVLSRSPLPRARRIGAELALVLGRALRSETRVAAGRIWRVIDARFGRVDAIHVVVASARHADFAAQLIAARPTPSVAQVMDLYRASPGEPLVGFARLFRHCSSVLCLGPALAETLAPLTSHVVRQVSVGRPMMAAMAAAPDPAGPLRLVLCGRLYRGGAERIAAWLERLRSRGARPFAVSYFGADHASLPSLLRGLVTETRWLADGAEVGPALARAHLALLEGPDCMDQFGRYSFPSRVADFLMAGLPILSFAVPQSNAARMLADLAGDAVTVVAGEAELAVAVGRFASDPGAWWAASAAARVAALRHFDLASVQREVTEALDAARIETSV